MDNKMLIKIWLMLIATYGYIIATSISTFGWWSLVTLPCFYYLFGQMAKIGEKLDD